MDIALQFFVWLHLQFIHVMESIVFQIDGISVNFFQIVVSFIIIFTILAVFWKGARA